MSLKRLVGIAIKKGTRQPMERVESALVTTEAGVAGDYKGSKSKNRQVTVLSSFHWLAVCQELGISLPWTERRANLLLSGFLKFGPELVGKHIHIGKEVVLEITGETFACGRMEEIKPGLKDALDKEWRGGVTCKVLHGGVIKFEDEYIIK